MQAPPQSDPAPLATSATQATDAVPLDADARALCAATAGWLRASPALEWLALAACAAALWRLLAAPAHGETAWTAWAAWAVLALALPERMLALRLRFDRGLFVDLAEGRIASLQALDAALSRWRATAPGAPRPLDARIAGTLRLWRRHAAAVGAQALLCLLALLPAG